MAINKDSNGYTFGFAITLVVVVGSILALLAMGLKEKQKENEIVKKQLDILSAMMDVDTEGIDRSNAKEEFKKYVNLDSAVVLNYKGEILEGIYDVKGNIVEGKAFDVDIQQEFKDKKRKEEFRNFPLFKAEMDGKRVYVIPVIGKGLWGPIWGNVCIDTDMNTIKGASFGHKGETPGLGAEITQQFFINGWKKEQIAKDNVFSAFKIVKDGSGAGPNSKVDGITGGTITSKGVEEMANRCLAVYVPYFNKLKNK